MNEIILDRLSNLSRTGAAEALALETNHPGAHACEPAGCPIPGACSAAKEIASLRAKLDAVEAEVAELRHTEAKLRLRIELEGDKLAAAEAERDEADRRAGAAERCTADRIAELEDDAQGHTMRVRTATDAPVKHVISASTFEITPPYERQS